MPDRYNKEGTSPRRTKTRTSARSKTLRFETVQVQLASSAYIYLRRAFELGALEGPSLSQMTLNPAVQQLMQAIHHVLAGGELEERLLKKEGDPKTVEELDRRMRQVIEETNLINDEAGFYKAIVAF